MVNEQLVRSMYHLEGAHTREAVGRYFKKHTGQLVQVIGMVADGKYFLTSETPQEAAFFSILQQPSANTSLIVRTRPDASGMAAANMAVAVRKLIHDLDPAIAIRSSGTWTTQLAFSFFPAQVAAVALSLFGVFGLLLSITGTFGLASYTVSKRMRELSIRVALGAAKAGSFRRTGAHVHADGDWFGGWPDPGSGHRRAALHIVYQATAQDPVVLAAVACTVLLTGFSLSSCARPSSLAS